MHLEAFCFKRTSNMYSIDIFQMIILSLWGNIFIIYRSQPLISFNIKKSSVSHVKPYNIFSVEDHHHQVNYSTINDAVCRLALATPGLLNLCKTLFNQQIIHTSYHIHKKNPAYGRHQLSRPMRIEGPIQI